LPHSCFQKKILRLISFGGLYVQAIGFGNTHVKHDGEGLHFHHARAAKVIIFEAKGCVTWCPKRLQDKDHTYISGSMDERITISSRCLHETQQKALDIFGFSKSPCSLRSNESSGKTIGDCYKWIWPNHRRLHVLKFWTASSTEVKQP
jgi:hypothetical protein